MNANSNVAPLTDEERELVDAYRALSPGQRERLWYFVDHPNDTEYVVLSFAGLCALGVAALLFAITQIANPISAHWFQSLK